MTKSVTEKLLEMQKLGFWIRTKAAPFRAVKWLPTLNKHGRPTLRGQNWVEVLPHGQEREPERFFAADVEYAGPHEHLTYYPAADEPLCGWGRPRLPRGEMTYCARLRHEDEAFCRLHMQELEDGS